MTSSSEYHSLLQFLYRAPVGLIETDAAGVIEMMNPISARLLMPLSRNGCLDNLFTALQDVAPQLRQLTDSVADSNGPICEYLSISLPPEQGEQRGPKSLSLSLFKQSDTKLIAMISDGTSEVQREQDTLSREVDAIARRDSLTGMPNRLALVEQLQFVMRRAAGDADHEFAVFCINCGRLALVNDTFGHAVGGQLVNVLADRLRSIFPLLEGIDRQSDHGRMIAHVSEGQFVVVLEHAGLHDKVDSIAGRLVDFLNKPYLIGPGEIRCVVSIGVVLDSNTERNPDAVVENASLAMAAAERGGGGRYAVFDHDMRVQATRRGDLEADLRLALTEKQFFVVYQPVVGLKGFDGTGGAVDRSAGVEALVRWRHPTRGILSPGAFIQIAEEIGAIREIGEFVLRTACKRFAGWQAQLGAAAPRVLAVNLSRDQLGQAGLVAMIDEIVRSSGICPGQLQLEVTESLAAQDHAVRSRLRELKALGLTLALDDFGTGYSSLSSLHELPVDTVKIDRSFVTEAPANPHLRALIDATVRVAHALNMTTVAEGIETEAQANIVRALGSDKGQGYLFSKPLSSDDLERWLVYGGSL